MVAVTGLNVPDPPAPGRPGPGFVPEAAAGNGAHEIGDGDAGEKQAGAASESPAPA